MQVEIGLGQLGTKKIWSVMRVTGLTALWVYQDSLLSYRRRRCLTVGEPVMWTCGVEREAAAYKWASGPLDAVSRQTRCTYLGKNYRGASQGGEQH